jgi:hypothetical protein
MLCEQHPIFKPTSGTRTMRTKIIAASFALLVLPCALSAQAQVVVGGSINIAGPGVFGRLELGGGEPPPAVVYAQPVLVAPPPPTYAPPPPVYLYVPLEHQRDWRHHCALYHACGVPVYFVREDWYHRAYEPRYQRREWQESHAQFRHEEHREGERREEHREGEHRDREERRDR